MSDYGTAPESAFQAYQPKAGEKKKNKSKRDKMNDNGTPGKYSFQVYKGKSEVVTKTKKKKPKPSFAELQRVVAEATGRINTPTPATPSLSSFSGFISPVKKRPKKVAPEEKRKRKKEASEKKRQLKLQRKRKEIMALNPEKSIMSPLLKKIKKPEKLDSEVSLDNNEDGSPLSKKRKNKDNAKIPRYFSIEGFAQEATLVAPEKNKKNKAGKANGNYEPQPLTNEPDSADDDIPILVGTRKEVNIVELDAENEEHVFEGVTKVHDASRVHLDDDNESSIDKGKELLENIIAPMRLHTFLQDFWEKSPVVVKRNIPDYFSQLDLTSESLDAMLRKNHLRFTKNIDITTYKDGQRETLNPPGRAMPAEVWDYYNEGASVRWLNPQTFSARLWLFCATLQEYFGCFVGANLYLTPPNTQGFAPHYDDIEAFILQLEGSKQWKLYHPRSDAEVLPRYSSGNFDRAEVGEPFMEVTLNAGDVLYFPRGTIHEAVAGDTHSLHATLSVYQRNAWADLMEKLIPEALSSAIAQDGRFREGLPIGHLSYAGEVHSESSSAERTSFLHRARVLARAVVERMDVDAAVDQLAARFMADSLPPVLTEPERRCSMAGDGERMAGQGVVVNSWTMDEGTRVKLVRAHCVRLVFELGSPKLYYTLDNTREYHEEEPGFFEILPEMVPCVKMLIHSYPAFLAVESFPLETIEQKMNFAGELWLKGLLLTDRPLGDEPEAESSDSD